MQCSMQCLPMSHLWSKNVFGQEEGWSQGCGHSYCRLITQKMFKTKIFYESLPVQTSYKSTLKHKVLLKCPLQDALPCKEPLLSQVAQPGAGAEEQEWNTRGRTTSLQINKAKESKSEGEGKTNSNTKCEHLLSRLNGSFTGSRRVL